MPIQSPYRTLDSQEDEQDPYRRQSPDGAIVEPMQDDVPVQEQPAKAPTATEPSQKETVEKPIAQAPAQTPTFKQMQDAGQARPPMPATMMLQHQMGGGPEQVAPETGLPGGAISQFPPAMIEPENPTAGVGGPVSKPAAFPPPIIEPAQLPPAVLPPDAIIEPGDLGLPSVGGQSVDAIIEPPSPTGGVDTGDASPESSVDLLSMLLNGVQNDSELGDATEQAALDQIHNPSPYNADVVKQLYGDLGAGIDADYDSRIRGLDEGMAARGLYGSSGKDFHSGRLADTELGRRDAKTSLAHNLATDYAKSYGDYNANAISQGQNVSGQDDASTLQWLQSLLGFGQQGFENDLATAQFDANQNSEYQQLLQMMLAAGYGA